MKVKLIDSFIEILKCKPFDKVTIKEICDGCDVGRQTFYYHFQDKYELVTFIYNLDVHQAISSCQQTDWLSNLTEILFQMQMNRAFYKNVLDTRGQNSLYEYLQNYDKQLYKRILIESGIVSKIEEKLEFSINCHAYACVNMTSQWLSDDSQYSPREFAELLIHSMPLDLKEKMMAIDLNDSYF